MRQIGIFFLAAFFAVFISTTDAQDKNSSRKDSAKSADSKVKQSESNDQQQKESEKPKVRVIALSGGYADLPQAPGFNAASLLGGGGGVQKSFYKLTQFIKDLTDDDEFDYVVFDLSAPFSMNSAQLDELTRYMQKLSELKKTYAWLENAGNAALCVAATCDKVFMADFGGLDMPSNSMQSMFFGDAFNLLGVEASVVRAGNFKGAVEPYLNSRMSTHLRQHNLEMLNSLNDSLVDRLARARGLKKVDVRNLQKERIVLPGEAVEAGLVDELAPYGAMQESIGEDIGEDVQWVTAKKAKKKKLSFFQVMTDIMSGSNKSNKIKKNTIAVIHLSGTIVDGKKKAAGNIVSGPTVEMIERLANEDKVKGAVVRINSPGGSATASEAIRQALLKLAESKPTVVSMGSVAASGGYWVSCIGTPVYAERGTITGSIGVFSMKISAGALMRRVGIHVESIGLDESAAAFSTDRPWSATDKARLQKTIDMVYDRFLGLVSDARDIKTSDLHDLAGGRVWSGAQAHQRNLVDHIGGLDDCLALIAKKADLGDGYNVVHRPSGGAGLDLSSLLGDAGEEEIWSNLSGSAIQLLKQTGVDLRQTRMLIRDGLQNRSRPTIWLLTPYEFSIR